MKNSAATEAKKTGVTARVSVLVADDDERLRKVVSHELRDRGYECVTEGDGAAALKAFGERDFDVALLDLEMPEIDGFEVLAALQRDHPNTVSVVLTGSGDIPRAVRAMTLGAFDFLEKPCNPHLLESTIRRAAEYRRAQQYAREMEAAANECRSALHLERAASQAQRLESVGRLAAGIAHEINTPTQYVGDNIEFLQMAHGSVDGVLKQLREVLAAAAADPAAPPLLSEAQELVNSANLEYLMNQIPRAIEQSLEGVERISSIVQAMKEFSHPGAAEKTPSDLNQCIRSTITVSRNEWKYVADLETDLDASLPPVCCLHGELNQVILNLIVNAAHAIGDVVAGTESKGKITVSTRHDGAWVEIRVTDTGSGIPEEIRDRIFDPFFSTKAVGRGTGQGLAIAQNVVVGKHGGTLAFETKLGVGTTFIIRVPIEA